MFLDPNKCSQFIGKRLIKCSQLMRKQLQVIWKRKMAARLAYIPVTMRRSRKLPGSLRSYLEGEVCFLLFRCRHQAVFLFA